MAKKQTFEVINIVENSMAFKVEIEIKSTRQRRNFGYPRGEGWEELIEGEPKFIIDIRSRLNKEIEVATSQSLQDKIDSIKTDTIGKSF